VPAGVFNLVQGDGPGVGAAIAAHPHNGMGSLTGSTRAGNAVAPAAAPTATPAAGPAAAPARAAQPPAPRPQR
jgi:aldehyde dehydrogenase (NAD+)